MPHGVHDSAVSALIAMAIRRVLRCCASVFHLTMAERSAQMHAPGVSARRTVGCVLDVGAGDQGTVFEEQRGAYAKVAVSKRFVPVR